MRVRLLGPVAVGDDASTWSSPPGQVPAAVLAHLALARGHALTPEALADRVWDEPPDGARNALQAAIARLRRTYGGGILETTAVGYRLPVEHVDVDVLRAEEEEAEARAARDRRHLLLALDLTTTACARFVGEPLAGLASDTSASARTTLGELHRRLVVLRAECLLELGRSEDAIGPLREECRERPLDEPLHALLMRVLAAGGRSPEALAAYDLLRRRLADELGTDPSPAVADTFAAILAGHLGAASPQTGARPAHPTVSEPRDVAVVLSDVVRSARLWQEHPDVMPEVMLLHHRVVESVVLDHGGMLPPDQGEGDARLAVFSSAAAALAATGLLQHRFAEADWPGGVRPHVRVAVTAGTVVEAGGNVFGTTVHRCARLRSLAWGDQVLVSQAAARAAWEGLDPRWRLTSLGRVSLRDFGDDEVFQLDEAAHPVTFPPLPTTVRLPAEVSRFVGRLDEIEDTADTVRRHRLVSLTGIGGIGKTRLAIQVARLVSDTFPGGVSFVDGSSALTADDVLAAVAATVDLTIGVDDALRALEGPSTLLLLDNLEQVVDADVAVRSLLERSTASLLVTSRRPVGVLGEIVRPLGPMTDADALALLTARAHEAVPDVAVDREQARLLVDALGATPLALELAASRLRVMGIDEVTEAVESRLAVLRGGAERPERHQAVAALIADSWVALTDDARRIVVALGLFRSGASTTTLSRAVARDIVDTLDDLEDLVGRGLVRALRRDGSTPRFEVLELVRRFALDHATDDDLRVLRRSHAGLVAELAERAEAPRLAELRDDVAAAIRQVRDDEGTDVALRLALARSALAFGWWDDAVTVLEPCAQAPEARNTLGVALLRRDEAGDLDRGRDLLRSAATEGDSDAASALGGSFKATDPDQSHQWYLEALRLAPGDPYALGNVVEHELREWGPATLIDRRDDLVSARERRRAQCATGEDLPWSAFDLAKLRLWTGDTDGGLHALLDAVGATTNVRQVTTTLASFASVADHVAEDAWHIAVAVLQLAVALHAPSSTRGDAGLPGPVLVLAGASAAEAHDEVMGWAGTLQDAWGQQGGTVLSGGTTSGVSALARVVADGVGARSIGFLPASLPAGVISNEGYNELLRTASAGFSLLEPVSYWTFLLGVGVRPRDVHVLGIGGGDLTDLELHLASAIGAVVAITDRRDSARGRGVATPTLLPQSADALGRWLRG